MDNLYTDLMNLIGDESPFYFKDFFKLGRTLRIFNYRLSSWTEFQRPGARNCRGTMFDITDSRPILLSLPMEKFFNYEEGGVDHEANPITFKMEKMDGSLISSYTLGGELFLKSKGSLESDQAKAANLYLHKPENKKLKEEILYWESKGFTVNMEYTAPTNRIVVPYQEERLTVLQLRDTVMNGMVYDTLQLSLWFEAKEYLVKYDSVPWGISQSKLIDDMRAETVGEGYVLKIQPVDKPGYCVKVKNTKYLALHKTKDSITCPSRLFEVIINKASDDLKAIFWDDPAAVKMVEEMEQKVIPVFNGLVNQAERFFETNKNLSRKDYAIKAQLEVPKIHGPVMGLYLQKNPPTETYRCSPFDWKEFAIKRRDEFFELNLLTNEEI